MRRRLVAAASALTLAVAMVGVLVGALGGPATAGPQHHTAAQEPAQKHCAQPAAGQPFETATPTQEQLDPEKVQEAVLGLSARLRISVMVFRHSCLVAGDPAPVERAFDQEMENGSMPLPAVMSRKKQVAPKLLAAL